MGRAFLAPLLAEHVAGEYRVKECSMAKLWQTEMPGKVVDECPRFFGGYGYMLEYPISRARRRAATRALPCPHTRRTTPVRPPGRCIDARQAKAFAEARDGSQQGGLE